MAVLYGPENFVTDRWTPDFLQAGNGGAMSWQAGTEDVLSPGGGHVVAVGYLDGAEYESETGECEIVVKAGTVFNQKAFGLVCLADPSAPFGIFGGFAGGPDEWFIGYDGTWDYDQWTELAAESGAVPEAGDVIALTVVDTDEAHVIVKVFLNGDLMVSHELALADYPARGAVWGVFNMNGSGGASNKALYWDDYYLQSLIGPIETTPYDGDVSGYHAFVQKWVEDERAGRSHVRLPDGTPY